MVASNNVLDVLDDPGRQHALGEIARVLRDEGALLFSSHNRAHIPHLDTSLRSAYRGALRSPRGFARAVYASRTITRRMRNRRLARSFERLDGDYALVNDAVHDHRLVHYYITRDAQAAQLAEAGLELVACFDIAGRPVPPGETAERSASLHYAARRRTSAAN